MLIGYNAKRPSEKDYRDFEKKLVSGISNLRIDGLSLMIYGSYVRGDPVFGRSDIDAVLIFPDNVVIDKKNLHSTSIVLRDAIKDKNIPFQVNVTDICTLRDGRFNSYDATFREYFDEEAQIIGPDYRMEIRYELPIMCEQVPVRFNLRKIRNGLLFAEHDRAEDYESFLKKFTKSLDAVSRATKQILYFSDSKLGKNRFSAAVEIKNTYPHLDTEPLLKIKRLYTHLDELDQVYRKPEELLQIWNSSATFMEEMIKSYIEKHPKNP